jgi:RNA polymerase sigma-32 factor
MSSIETETTMRANRRFVKKAMATPMLEQEHEYELARRWRDEQDERALHELTAAYMRLVISMAGRFRNYGLPVTDLVQEGNVGLMLAAARFEPERGVRFSTYASWWIRSCIQDYVLRNWSIVRTGTTASQKSLFFNLRRLRAMIDDVGEGTMTAKNRASIATTLGVPEHDVEMMAARLSASDRSLNAFMGEDSDGEWQDFLVDGNETPDERVMRERDSVKRKDWLEAAMTHLNPREVRIIRERRLSDEGRTLEALGQDLGISKERVRQIEHQAMLKLKRALERLTGDPLMSGLVPDA